MTLDVLPFEVSLDESYHRISFLAGKLTSGHTKHKVWFIMYDLQKLPSHSIVMMIYCFEPKVLNICQSWQSPLINHWMIRSSVSFWKISQLVVLRSLCLFMWYLFNGFPFTIFEISLEVYLSQFPYTLLEKENKLV